MLNRVPWLPNVILKREFSTEMLTNALNKGAKLIGRIDKFIHPRLNILTSSTIINRFHGIALIMAGLLLVLPLSFIPFSNTLPAFAVVFLAAGLIQRDGLFIIFGYITLAMSMMYFGGLTVAALAAGNSLNHLLGS